MIGLREFAHPNLSDGAFRCPVCQTRADQPVVLVQAPKGFSTGIFVRVDKRNVEAVQIHAECYRLAMKMTILEKAPTREPPMDDMDDTP